MSHVELEIVDNFLLYVHELTHIDTIGITSARVVIHIFFIQKFKSYFFILLCTKIQIQNSSQTDNAKKIFSKIVSIKTNIANDTINSILIGLY